MTNLIPLSYLNEACFLSMNVDEKKYNMVLKLAQQDLRDILGPEFYDEIVDQYDEDSLTEDNETLYEDYIKDFLAWQTYYKFLKFANVDVTPTGVREFAEENSTVASDIKMYSLEKNIMSEAVNYRNRMINHIKEAQANDSSKFPLWEDDCKETYSFAITSVDKSSDALIRVNNSIVNNE